MSNKANWILFILSIIFSIFVTLIVYCSAGHFWWTIFTGSLCLIILYGLAPEED